jgi:hypothetical protein
MGLPLVGGLKGQSRAALADRNRPACPDATRYVAEAALLHQDGHEFVNKTAYGQGVSDGGNRRSRRGVGVVMAGHRVQSEDISLPTAKARLSRQPLREGVLP